MSFEHEIHYVRLAVMLRLFNAAWEADQRRWAKERCKLESRIAELEGR